MADAPTPHDTVLGFHACEREFAQRLLAGEISLEEWSLSENPYDWLGDGIYFWENNLRRAMEWAEEMVKGEPAVIEAEIRLGRCFDLTSSEEIDALKRVYDEVVLDYNLAGKKLPRNRDLRRGTMWQQTWLSWLDTWNAWLYPVLAGVQFERASSRKLRYLDRLVLNQLNEAVERFGSGRGFQTIRGAFEEGDPVFSGSMIRRQSHVQIAVRDRSCITLKRIHLPRQA